MNNMDNLNQPDPKDERVTPTENREDKSQTDADRRFFDNIRQYGWQQHNQPARVGWRVLMLIVMAAWFALMSLLVMWLWNSIVPRLFTDSITIATIGFFKAAGLLLLCKILFGRGLGFRHRCGRCFTPFGYGHRFADRDVPWADMNDDQRRAFRQEFRQEMHRRMGERMGNRFGKQGSR